MKPRVLAAASLGLSLSLAHGAPRPKLADENALVPPSTPLVACDPYFSIWSPGDKLNETETTHWTGKKQPLSSLVKIDGKAYRVIGAKPDSTQTLGDPPEPIPVLEQKSLTVLPTRTLYTFEGAGIALTLTFTTPAFPEDIDMLSRPVTYLTYDFHATDGKSHTVSLYFGASAELTVNTPDQAVTWNDASADGLSVVRLGSKNQPVLQKKGDDQRIDWGYLYIAAPEAEVSARAFHSLRGIASVFLGTSLSEVKWTSSGEADRADATGAALELKPFQVADKPISKTVLIAYDDLYSIQFNHKNLRPYWRRNGWEAKDLLAASFKQFPAIQEHAAKFDSELMADLTALGGEKYAKLSALAYRQCFAAGKFVADEKGQPLQFCKENHSNGCISTSDVFYPMAPQFLLFGPSLAKSFLVPFLEYARSDRWKFPFAPHDLGTYPQANGQVYGGGERTEDNQMPVEESGNVLLLVTAIARMEGNADFAAPYWPRLVQWAGYLKKEGYDPANQLCTDDFAGHLAHNVNLSAKAICALGAFSKLCEMRGEKALAADYAKTAAEYAARWVQSKDGDHYRLAFDRPGTWSQKYNLVWDKILGLGLFPDQVLRTEVDYYKTKQNTYGIPLDNRRDYTKLDWIVWTASLTQDKADFTALTDPLFKFLNESADRSPMNDWFETKDAKKVGFTARPVVGGVFIPALYHQDLWKKYASRDHTKAKGWAAMPDYVPPVIVNLTPTADEKDNLTWQYTTTKPAADWAASAFTGASSWSSGAAGFGAGDPPHTHIRTKWDTADIWARTELTLPASLPKNIAIGAYHDEDLEVYINGVLAASAGGFVTEHVILPLTEAGRAALKPGKNLIAVHCHQTTGGQYLDVNVIDVQPGKKK